MSAPRSDRMAVVGVDLAIGEGERPSLRVPFCRHLFQGRGLGASPCRHLRAFPSGTSSGRHALQRFVRTGLGPAAQPWLFALEEAANEGGNGANIALSM